MILIGGNFCFSFIVFAILSLLLFNLIFFNILLLLWNLLDFFKGSLELFLLLFELFLFCWLFINKSLFNNNELDRLFNGILTYLLLDVLIISFPELNCLIELVFLVIPSFELLEYFFSIFLKLFPFSSFSSFSYFSSSSLSLY